jgi:RNA polymerase sigma-70 factor, ECF subfamily
MFSLLRINAAGPFQARLRDRRPTPAGETSSFKEIYREYSGFVASLGRRFGIPPDGVDDLVQDVFMVIHSRLHTLEEPQMLRNWIYGVVRRTASNHRRASRARRISGDESAAKEIASQDPTPLERAQRNAERRLLSNLLNTLEEPKRQVLTLVEVQELSVPEAAEVIGIPLNTAYSRLRSARQAFDSAISVESARFR